MIPMTREVDLLGRHFIGETQLLPIEGRVILREAVELNADSQPFIQGFGNRTLLAVVGFIDLVRFSEHTQGKDPAAIARFIQPFIQSMIEVGKRTHAFIDKTIGDEVMLIWPCPTPEGALAGIELPRSECIALSYGEFIAGLAAEMREKLPSMRFTCGMGIGEIYLAKIGSDEYSEWTCYGNIVTVAKRLQAEASESQSTCQLRVAVGVLAGGPVDPSEIIEWPGVASDFSHVVLDNPVVNARRNLKGTDPVTYLVAGIDPKIR